MPSIGELRRLLLGRAQPAQTKPSDATVTGIQTAAAVALASAIPIYSIAGSAVAAGTTSPGYPLPGQILISDHGKFYVNLPSGGRHYLPSCVGVNRHELIETFNQKPGLFADRTVPAANTYNTAQMQLVTDANPNFGLAGTNMTSALCTFAGGGGIKLTTAGASNDQGLLAPHTNTNATSWLGTTFKTDDVVWWETVVGVTSAAITSQKLFAGLKLTSTPLAATDNDQAYFLYDTGGTDGSSTTNWIAVSSRSNADTFVDTGIPIALSANYHLAIMIDPDRVPYFFINGVMVAWGNVVSTAALTVAAGALTTAITLKPFAGVQALAVAAKAITIRRITASKVFND